MANREVEITVKSAKDLINVNWRHGILKPYAVVWVDRNNYKSFTRVDDGSDTSPCWDQTLTIPLNAPIDDSFLYIDIIHFGSPDDNINPLVGWARLALRDVFDDVGFGECVTRMLDVKRPSGRPQGKLDVRVSVRERRYNMHDPYYVASISYRSQMPHGQYVAPYGLPQTPDYGSGQVAQEAEKGRSHAAQEAKKGIQAAQETKKGRQATQEAKKGIHAAQETKEGRQATHEAKKGIQAAQETKKGRQATHEAKKGSKLLGGIRMLLAVGAVTVALSVVAMTVDAGAVVNTAVGITAVLGGTVLMVAYAKVLADFACFYC